MSEEQKTDVYIGTKQLSEYILSTTMILLSNNKVTLHARGRAISKAFDVAEICKRMLDVKITNVESNSDYIGEKYITAVRIVLEK